MTKQLNQLKACKSRSDLAKLLGYKPKSLSFILYHIPDHKKYTSFSIPKKSGGSRDIDAPISRLKVLQRRVADHLQACLVEVEEAEGVKNKCGLSHGFHPNRTIATNAHAHSGQRWVFNLDLQDFFPSVNFGRVRGFFMKNKYFLLEDQVATTLAQIACHNNALPQGSPCSPVITNLIANNLDIRLSRIAKKHRCTYTRYADDLTFSTSKKRFPIAIAKYEGGVWKPSDRVGHSIFSSGFLINPSKTRMQYYWSRQDTTGLVVNKKVNVRREYVKKARARCHNLITKGEVFEVQELWGAPVEVPYDRDRLAGELSHIFWVKGKEHSYKRHRSPFGEWPNFYQDHQKFLDFVDFADNQTPTILFEGKTDNIYVKLALKSLAAKFPNLVSSDPGNPLLVKLFNYSRQTDALQGLAGGTGDLKVFINTYRTRIARLSAASLIKPTIIVVDNDKGADEVFKAAGGQSDAKTKVDGSKPFYHINNNLYLVAIPMLKGKKETFIEDLFLPVVHSEKLGSKTFHLPSKGFDKTKHYGKVPFAEKVVAKKRGTIDFSQFEPLLRNIDAAILDYDAKVAGKP